MKKNTQALLLSCFLFAGLDLANAAAEQTVGKQVGAVLKESADRMGSQQFSAATAALKTALQANGLTEFERFSIHRLLVGAAQGEKQHTQVVESAKFVLSSPFLQEQERATLTSSLMNAYLRTSQFTLAADLADESLARTPDDLAMMETRLKANYLGKRFEMAVINGETLLQTLRRQQKKPSLEVLKIIAASAAESGNDSQYEKALRMLVANYPSAEYWSDLLYRAQAANVFARSGEIHFYRLLSTSNSFRDPGEFIDAAEAAIKLGFPLEAQRYLDQGVKQGLLPNATLKFQYDEKRKQVERIILQDSQVAAKNAVAKTPAAASANGFNTLLQGHAETGLQAMKNAAELAGKANSGLQLNFAVALAWAGQNEPAASEFRKLLKDPTISGVAGLWMLLLKPEDLE